MSEKKRDCPILLALDRYPIECIKEDCAWWDDENDCCAVLTVARTLEIIADTLMDLPVELHPKR